MKSPISSPTRIGNLVKVAVLSCCLILMAAGCAQRLKPKVYAKEFQFRRPFTARPGTMAGSAAAWEGCMRGSYYHDYTIAAGVHQGDVWLCCVPINELLRDSFHCGGLGFSALIFGTEDDAKVQTCMLVDATSTTGNYIPACIPAPLTADRDKEAK